MSISKPHDIRCTQKSCNDIYSRIFVLSPIEIKESRENRFEFQGMNHNRMIE